MSSDADAKLPPVEFLRKMRASEVIGAGIHKERLYQVRSFGRDIPVFYVPHEGAAEFLVQAMVNEYGRLAGPDAPIVEKEWGEEELCEVLALLDDAIELAEAHHAVR